jgi:uncharacterized membrane protein
MAGDTILTSTATGRPLHAILAAYPLAFFTAALATDLAYAGTADVMWANFSIWLISGGLAFGVLAAIVGIVDFVANRRARRLGPGWLHSLGNALVLLLSLVNAFVHSRDAWTSVMPWGLTLSAIVTILVLITSWMGATLVYRDRLGVA